MRDDVFAIFRSAEAAGAAEAEAAEAAAKRQRTDDKEVGIGIEIETCTDSATYTDVLSRLPLFRDDGMDVSIKCSAEWAPRALPGTSSSWVRE